MVRNFKSILSGRLSILTMLTLVGCIACFVAAYTSRKQHIEKIQQIKFVKFESSEIVSSNAQSLPLVGDLFSPMELRYLTKVSIYSLERHGDLIKRLAKCKSMRGLLWSKIGFTKESAGAIASLPVLNVLNVQRVEDCSMICSRSEEFESLELLTFSKCGITGEDCQNLSNLRSLKVLVFDKCDVDSSEVDALRTLMTNTFIIHLTGG